MDGDAGGGGIQFGPDEEPDGGGCVRRGRRGESRPGTARQGRKRGGGGAPAHDFRLQKQPQRTSNRNSKGKFQRSAMGVKLSFVIPWYGSNIAGGAESLCRSAVNVSRLSWKWRERSPVKITERTREETTKALHR